MMSRLEWAMRDCCAPGKIVRIRANDAERARLMFERACELIPRTLVKRYGLQSIIFSNDSRIEFTTKDAGMFERSLN
jgi:hypothetical protein